MSSSIEKIIAPGNIAGTQIILPANNSTVIRARLNISDTLPLFVSPTDVTFSLILGATVLARISMFYPTTTPVQAWDKPSRETDIFSQFELSTDLVLRIDSGSALSSGAITVLLMYDTIFKG